MMRRNDNTAIDGLWESAERWLPVFSPDEQRAGLVLLRELARGEPVTIARLARALGQSGDAAEGLMKASALSRFVNAGEDGRIKGFWGLSVAPTHHQFGVNGRKLWTWCAQDSLFLPELLGDTAEIESLDPETDELIRLTVSPARVEAVQPAGVMVSMGRPETWDATSATRIMATACHFIYFFGSRDSGERWQAKHPAPGTVLLSLESAFDLGKRSNAHLFGAELRQRRDAPNRTDAM